MRCISFVIFILLAAAVIMDFQYDRIFNEWILVTLLIGLSYRAWSGGAAGIVQALIYMTIPFMLLYPLFMVGGLGAGDIKLLAVMGCFFTLRQIVICLAVTFLIGAVFSFLKMLAEGNLLQRMHYLLSYTHDVFRSGEWKLYETDIQERKTRNKDKIHFALPVLLSVMLIKGGRF